MIQLFMKTIRLVTLGVGLSLALMAGNASASVNSINGVGLVRIEAVDPVSLKPMDVAAFYPSLTGNTFTAIGPYDIDGERQLAIAPGEHPAIIISHGNSGGVWGHHDLASHLARAGFIVITLTHPGDNYQDSSGVGAISTVYGRPLQISAALDAALKEPFLAPAIDKKRIAFIGFSAGGQTGLLLAGAKPDFSRLEIYCASHSDTALCENKGSIRTDRPDLLLLPDGRIRAIILLAPLSVTFPVEVLKGLDIPVMLYVAEHDEELAPAENAYALAGALPRVLAVHTIPRAGHFVFLATCSERMLRTAPYLCVDTSFIDRAALHKTMSVAIAGFLRQALTATTDKLAPGLAILCSRMRF